MACNAVCWLHSALLHICVAAAAFPAHHVNLVRPGLLHSWVKLLSLAAHMACCLLLDFTLPQQTRCMLAASAHTHLKVVSDSSSDGRSAPSSLPASVRLTSGSAEAWSPCQPCFTSASWGRICSQGVSRS